MEYLKSLFSREAEKESDELTETVQLSLALKKPTEGGVYYSRDSLKNFKIRVTLRKVTASGGGGVGVGIVTEETGRMSRASGAGVQATTDTEEWVFKWQEKVFSQHEDELFADANNCINPLQLRYHREILQQRSEGCRPNGRLFSLVEADHHLLQSTMETTKYQTFASKYSSSVRRRHGKQHKNQNVPKSVIHDPIFWRPSEEQRATQRINTPSQHSMCLMADLRKQDGVDLADEHILCHITVDGRGRVTVSPDFTGDRPAIRLENRHKEVFEYRVENASQIISVPEQLKEDQVQHELHGRHANYLKGCVGETFADPPEEGAVRVCIHGEIALGEGFEHNDLYIRAQLELSEGWQLEDDSTTHSLTFTSQISATKSLHLRNVAHFGCPFEYHLVHTPMEDELCSRPVRLLLEVCSLDYWDRHRVEGYGYLDLPTTPGSYDMSTSTWRPGGRGLVAELRRYFVGGDEQINDLSHIACPRDLQGDRLCRYGFPTVSSGIVRVHLSIAQQSSQFVRASQDQSESNSDQFKTHFSLSALLAAKKRAHLLATKLRAK